MPLGWVKVDELMVDAGDVSYEDADARAVEIVKEILEADPRIHVLRVLKPENLIFHD